MSNIGDMGSRSLKTVKAVMSVAAGLMALLMTACTLETSGNGELDGYWQMERIDTLATGGWQDMKLARRFWAVEVRLLQVQDLTWQHDTYLLRFEHRGDSLLLSDPYRKNQGGADEPVSDPSQLAPYGIERLDARFLIEQLDDDALVLKDETLRVKLRRY